MNTKELALKISQEFGISFRRADRILHFVFDEVKNSVSAGDPVRLAGVGTFSRIETKERIVKTPVKGDIKIPPHGKVKFSASSYFKEKVY